MVPLDYLSFTSARKLSFRLVKSKPESRSERVLKRMRERDANLHAGLVLFEELLGMLRRAFNARG